MPVEVFDERLTDWRMCLLEHFIRVISKQQMVWWNDSKWVTLSQICCKERQLNLVAVGHFFYISIMGVNYSKIWVRWWTRSDSFRRISAYSVYVPICPLCHTQTMHVFLFNHVGSTAGLLVRPLFWLRLNYLDHGANSSKTDMHGAQRVNTNFGQHYRDIGN